MLTPEHIVPEWYFLPILCYFKEQCQDKVLGIVSFIFKYCVFYLLYHIFWEGYEPARIYIF